MKISNDISKMKGVSQAAVVIGTPANLDLLRDMGLLKEGVRRATRTT
jgi:hypothetical protein